MSLYLKYRPKTIEELDLAGVRKTLGDMIAGDNLSHAYLFTGPRGAGKTSAARILARIVNCEKNSNKLGEPCNECEQCVSILTNSAVDVVEIDAASNRGIDDIRELKERIRLAPTRLRKKVYIIDEVHMLTTEAFNALLKTLEEPPDHAIFILCTTEVHKVPETIASRCTRVTFTKATREEMKRAFFRVIQGERSEIEEDALDAITAAVDGSFRDGVKILDTAVTLGKKVSLADVELILYGASGFSSKALSSALISKNLTPALEEFRNAMADGVDLVHLIVGVMKDLRNEILTNLDKSLIPLIFKLDETARVAVTSSVPELLTEMVLVDWCTNDNNIRRSKPDKPNPEMKTKKSESVLADKDEIKVEIIASQDEVFSQIVPGEPNAVEAWQKLTENLNGDSYSLGALLSKARPGIIRGDVLTIEMAHEFHKEQLMQEKFRARVEELVSKVMGRPMRVTCEIASRERTALAADGLHSTRHTANIADIDPEETELMDTVQDIFK